MKLKKVKDKANLVKDVESGAVLNNEKSALQAARAIKNQVLKEKESLGKVAGFDERLSKLEDSVAEILKFLKAGNK